MREERTKLETRGEPRVLGCSSCRPVPTPSGTQSAVRSEPNASGPCHPLHPLLLEVWGKEPENWVPTCCRKAPEEIGTAAARASSPPSSCRPPGSAR